MKQPDVTTVEAVSGWLKVSKDDAAVIAAHAAAEAFVRSRCRWMIAPPAEGDDWPTPPDDLVQAVFLLTGRALARRNSPDGLVGMGELGAIRISRIDADIESHMAPWRPVVFG